MEHPCPSWFHPSALQSLTKNTCLVLLENVLACVVKLMVSAMNMANAVVLKLNAHLVHVWSCVCGDGCQLGLPDSEFVQEQ